MLSAAETHALRSRRWARPAWPNIVDFPDHATFRENVAKLACADISPSESSISYLGRVAKRCHVALTRVMRGLSAKRALIPRQKLEMTCIIHYIKRIILLYLMIFFILRKAIKVETFFVF